MRGPRYRFAGHAAAAVLLAGVAVVATGAGAGAASGSGSDRPGSYGGNAVAASMEFRVDKQPFPFPVTDPFHSWVPYAGTQIDSSGGDESIASSIYPGQGILGVPALLCEFNAQLCQGVISHVPDYPDWAHAQYPSHKDASATLAQKPFPGTGPFEVTPNDVSAHADPDRVEATAVVGSSGLTGVATVQQASSHSLQTFQGSALVLNAESIVKGVDIGGQLHIDTITTVATAHLDGSKVGDASAVTTVSGATLAGQAVAIDSTGIHAAGQGDHGVLNQQLNSALKSLANQGISVRSLGSTKKAKVTGVAAEAGGVLVTSTQNFNGPSLGPLGQNANGQYLLTATIGGAGVNAFAAPAVPFQLGGVITPPVAQGGTTPAASSTGGVVQQPPTLPQTGSTTPSTGQPAVVAASPGKTVALPLDLTNKRLETLALVLLGYPLLMLLGAPLRAPSRLPRAR